jgi:hypothetical protein
MPEVLKLMQKQNQARTLAKTQIKALFISVIEG